MPAFFPRTLFSQSLRLEGGHKTTSLHVVCRGLSGPHDAGHYNSSSWETSFFRSQGGSWNTPYGDFFLSWYSGLLIKHTERVLSAARRVLNKRGRPRMFRAVKEVRAQTG